MKVFVPKPPPTSCVTTRKSCGSMPSTPETDSCNPFTPWLDVVSV